MAMTDEEIIQSISDEFRNRGESLDILAIARTALSRGVEVRSEMFHGFRRILMSRGESLAPAEVGEVSLAICEAREISSILDPFTNHGELIAPIARSHNAEGLAITRIVRDNSSLEDLNRISGVKWLAGDPLTILNDNPKSFDVVVASPPMGGSEVVSKLTGFPSEVRGTQGNLISALALSKIGSNGLGLVTITAKTISDESGQSVINSLRSVGIYVNGLLRIARPLFFGMASIDAYLAIFSRSFTAKVFIGEIQQSWTHNAQLAENFKKRKTGRSLSLGALVEHNDFRGYDRYQLDLDFKRLSARSKLPSMPLVHLVHEINLTKGSDLESFEDHENSVYLPMIGRSLARYSRADLSLKAHNYAQLVINTEMALAPYVAAYFNSQLGLLARQRALSETFIPKLTKKSIQESLVHIPELGVQRKCVELDSRIVNLTSELKSIRDSLWSTPTAVRETNASLNRVNRKDTFVAWIDTLPFPIASILWAYHADQDDDDKAVKALVHAFEAQAQFLALILWSAVRSSTLIEHDDYPLGQGKPLAYSLSNSSFGSWVELAGRLAKFLRKRMNTPEDASEVLGAFRTRNVEMVSKLCSSTLISHLSDANMLRNTIAHGGITSASETSNKRVLLESLLAKVRQEMGSIWDELLLLKAGENRYRNGIFTYDVELVMGRATLFKHLKVNVVSPIDDARLFLLAGDSQEPLVLEPFMVIAASPQSAENACYFYNSVKGAELKYVSYHFRGQPELLRTDERVSMALSDVGSSALPPP